MNLLKRLQVLKSHKVPPNALKNEQTLNKVYTQTFLSVSKCRLNIIWILAYAQTD